ncbi:26235_t:CDS:2 [Racocetra persica]|uniref:26235_t:CDS:1 n=1 Tax=Racocetra persica TaxID=160502 RepID=A0ACA9QKW5_9GLOM|nr:26235_t:CDS:2 [Racocetra persica]
MTTHFEYSFLSEIFLKVDILGHDEPTVLQKLFQLTGVNPLKICFQDPKIMEIFTKADTLGIPEFGTDFVQKNLLRPLQPTKFSELLQISGFSHGTNIFEISWFLGELTTKMLLLLPSTFVREFYSVLLTCHATVYDIWLMTLDPAAIIFRLESLLENPLNYKNNEKELLSIIRVLEELAKEKKRNSGQRKIVDLTTICENIKQKINNSSNEKLRENLRKNGKT